MPSSRRRYYKHRCLCVLSTLLVIARCVQGQADTKKIDDLVKRWAPLIWLAPDEKFFPLSVEEFLENVYPSDDDGKPMPSRRDMDSENLPQGKESEALYLHTRGSIDELKNATSFLYGKNPSKYSVPTYVTVSNCGMSSRTFLSLDYDEIINDIPNERAESDLHFHLSYWIFFPYNQGKEICVIGNIPAPYIFNTCFGHSKLFGNHVGDYEHLSLLFKGKPYPEEMFLSVHDAGVYYKYDPIRRLFKYKRQVKKGIAQRPKFPPIVRLSNGRPLLFSAFGSHGLWSAPGEHYYARVPRLSDENGYGTPWKTWSNLKIYHLGFSKPPMWMKYQGKWGNPKSKCLLSKKLGICEFFDGPPGVLTRSQDFYCTK